MFFIRDPKLLKKFAIKDFDHFTDHTTFIDENVDKLFGRSLTMLNGDKWRGKNLLLINKMFFLLKFY